jgi:hypothetical protein
MATRAKSPGKSVQHSPSSSADHNRRIASPRPARMRISLQAENQRRHIRWPKRTASQSQGPIVGALLALAGTIWVAHKTVVAQFAAKAAELALMGEGPPEIINRARLIAQLYGDLLPRDFKTRLGDLTEEDVGRIVTKAPRTSELWKDIVELLAHQPVDRRDQIIKDFISIFPEYAELKTLQIGIERPPTLPS